MKLQHFSNNFFLNFLYGDAAHEPLPGSDDYSGGEYPPHSLIKCWDPNTAEITSMNQEDQAPQPTLEEIT